MPGKKKKMRAKLIANPGSGDDSDRGQLLEEVTRKLKELGVKVDVAVAKPKENTIPIAKRAVKDGYKYIIAMGGDDTIEAIIRGVAGSKARLGIIPVGTANNLAKSLGIPVDPQQACALIASKECRKLDFGRVKVNNGKKWKKLSFFELVMVGIGAEIYPAALHVTKGRLSSLTDLIEKTFSSDSQPQVTVTMDGESRVKLNTMLAIVSNVPLIGPNMLVDPNASTDDGYFEVLLFPSFNKAELIAYFAKSTHEGDANDGRIQRYRARKISFKSSPKQDVMADGVMLGKGKVKIKIKPGGLRVIAPPVGTGVEKPRREASEGLPAPVAPLPQNGGESATKQSDKAGATP